MDTVYTLNKIVQRRLREDKPTYVDVQIVYATVWPNGLGLKVGYGC